MKVNKELFPKEKLKKLILPLLLDQLLIVMVGTVDTIMISSVGEAAVSGVSLVDNINMLVLTLFAGLAAGGSVLSAHYAGQQKKKEVAEILQHMLFISIGIAIVFMAIFLIGGQGLLGIIFGQADLEVLASGTTYFRILAVSFPFWGVYSSCAAVCRGLGNSKLPMLVSLFMNVLNIVGNAICLYGLNMGVEGVAVPTVISRIAAVVLIFYLMRRQQPELKLRIKGFSWNQDLVKKILAVGVPGSLEMGIFQVGKILVLGFIAKLGTAQITANAIGNTMNNLQALPEDAIGLALITVVGQCMGASRKEEAIANTKKLLKYTYVSMWIINTVIFLLAPMIVGGFHLTQDTAKMTSNIIRFNAIFAMTIWPLAFALPNALKGAYDVKYPLVVSMFSMWVFRVGFSYLVIRFLDANIYMLYVCFSIDWIFRAIMFTRRWLVR